MSESEYPLFGVGILDLFLFLFSLIVNMFL